MPKVTTHQEIGKRDYQQDAFYVGIQENLVAIADGHGMCGSEIAKEVIEMVKLSGCPPDEESILNLFNKIHQTTKDFAFGGTTLSCVFSTSAPNEFMAMQVGDSPIFWRENGVVKARYGHNAGRKDNPDYEQFLDKSFIQRKTRYIVSKDGRQLLNLTRSFADPGFELIRTPDIFSFTADAVLVASDGYSGDEEEVEILFKYGCDAAGVAKEQESRRGIYDNFTAIVIYE